MIASMGLVISHKNNEARRALIPSDLVSIKNADKLFFETGYGKSLGFKDKEYEAQGAHVVNRNEALACDMIVDVKLGDADYLHELTEKKTLIGWAHAAQNIDFTSNILKGYHTVLAWEELYQQGRYLFYRNREIAGEAAVMHAFQHYGKMPYECKVAIIGRGQTAKGALRILHGLGAEIDVFGRNLEALFRSTMFNYDVIVNCVLWDTNRTDRLIYREDLKKFRPGTLIIDISCDPYLEIETSHATTIDNPVYEVDGVIHYAVDNTPAIFYKTISTILSLKFSKLVDLIVESRYPDFVSDAIVIRNGCILCDKIRQFRETRGLYSE